MKVDQNNFEVVNLIRLYVCITNKKFPNTLLNTKRDSWGTVHFLLNSMIKFALRTSNTWIILSVLQGELVIGKFCNIQICSLHFAELNYAWKAYLSADFNSNICEKAALYIFGKHDLKLVLKYIRVEIEISHTHTKTVTDVLATSIIDDYGHPSNTLSSDRVRYSHETGIY
jgi:hypothetical protein